MRIIDLKTATVRPVVLADYLRSDDRYGQKNLRSYLKKNSNNNYLIFQCEAGAFVARRGHVLGERLVLDYWTAPIDKILVGQERRNFEDFIMKEKVQVIQLSSPKSMRSTVPKGFQLAGYFVSKDVHLNAGEIRGTDNISSLSNSFRELGPVRHLINSIQKPLIVSPGIIDIDYFIRLYKWLLSPEANAVVVTNEDCQSNVVYSVAVPKLDSDTAIAWFASVPTPLRSKGLGRSIMAKLESALPNNIKRMESVVEITNIPSLRMCLSIGYNIEEYIYCRIIW